MKKIFLRRSRTYFVQCVAIWIPHSNIIQMCNKLVKK